MGWNDRMNPRDLARLFPEVYERTYPDGHEGSMSLHEAVEVVRILAERKEKEDE